MKNSGLLLLALLPFLSCTNQQKQDKTRQQVNESAADNELLNKAHQYFLVLPASAENIANPETAEKVKLGKYLFFDTRLSKTGNNSCNSCHNLSTFGVDNLPVSVGDAGKKGNRNSPTCINAAFHISQFWDGRAKDVEEQAGGPILNPVEMNIPSKAFLEKRLNGISEYRALFKSAFPNEKNPVTYQNIQNAIAAYERTLLTPSPFDSYLKNNATALNAEQKEGLKTFIDVGCVQCHNGAVIGGNSYQKFGVFADYRTYTNSSGKDMGRFSTTKNISDKDFFKVPSLRNIAKTYPYFHDGSVKDLNEAVKIMGKIQLNKDLSKAQIEQIVSFLNALTGDLPAEVKKQPEHFPA